MKQGGCIMVSELRSNAMDSIEMTVNGHTGYAKVQWMLETEYNMPHYAAFICVPFQKSRWVHLFVSEKEEHDLAQI